MAEQADLGTPMKLRPASATKEPPPRVADAPRLGIEAARAAGSPKRPAEGSAASRGNEVDRRTLIVGEGIFPLGRGHFMRPARRRGCYRSKIAEVPAHDDCRDRCLQRPCIHRKR